MDLGLRGKCAVVTGASKGIGRAIALGLAQEGANVAICARGADALRDAERELIAQGGRACAEVCDVGDPGALGGFLETARQALDRVDILVNNASAFAMGDDEAGWESSLNVDVMAAVRACRKVVPWVAGSGGGCILHISSGSGLEAGSPLPTQRRRRPSLAIRRPERLPSLRRRSASTSLRRDPSSSPVDYGIHSGTTIQIFTPRCLEPFLGAGWARRKKWPTPLSFWCLIERAGSRASVLELMVASARQISSLARAFVDDQCGSITYLAHSLTMKSRVRKMKRPASRASPTDRQKSIDQA